MSAIQPQHTVAVIIPTLNEQRFISRCLDSVLAQTYPREKMDIMVADGGSTDTTRTIVEQYSAAYPCIRLLDNPRRVQAAAFNVGVSHSSAPFIIRMDAHATYEPHYIAECIALLSSHPEYGNVGGVCAILPQNDSLIAQANALLNHLRFGIGGAAFRVGTASADVDSVPFGAFRRDVVQQVGPMREDIGRAEDNEYNARIRHAGYIVRLDPAIRSSYFARATWADSCRQMYGNGCAIGNLLHIDRTAVGLRHLVPMAFVLSLVISAIVALFTTYGWALLAVVAGAYLLAAIVADIQACLRYGWRYAGILPPLFFCVHVSYGVGTLVGLIRIHK